MRRILIELTGNRSVELAYENATFTEKCVEITTRPFYVTLGDRPGSTLVSRDHIIIVRDLGEVK